MSRTIDLNSDLGESFGPWRMGDDDAMLGVVTSANVACGGHANLGADDRSVADAIARAIAAVSPDLAILAISGTELEAAGRHSNLAVYSEIFADRGYTPKGRLVPRSKPGAMIHDPAAAAQRLIDYIDTGRMPTQDGSSISLEAHSICVHGDSQGAVDMAKHVRARLIAAG